jgi:hypothetical protein
MTYRFIIWLLLFFSVFHCLLNILAEITMFGDRLLYEDWWNANTLLVGNTPGLYRRNSGRSGMVPFITGA